MKSFTCRVMRLVADPARPEELYAALEVGGVMRSLDGGETWDDCSSDLLKLAELPQLKSKIDSDTDIEGMLDGHAVCVSAAKPGTVFLAVRMGLFESADLVCFTSQWLLDKALRERPCLAGKSLVVRNDHRASLRSRLASIVGCADGNRVKTPVQISS